MPDLGSGAWVCGLCGVPTEIVWPVDPISIEAVLLMRPNPHTRNWVPPETLTDLIAENAAHGIFPPGVTALDGVAPIDLMIEVDGRVVGGLVYGPVEQWRAARTTDPSVTADGEPPAYLALPKGD
jgi:hypothetical protein